MTNLEIISVSKYLDKLNSALKVERAKIVGEVSGVQMYEGRSYLYFSLKDSKDQSTVKCFMWKRDFTLSGVTLRDGLEVIITAYPNIYKPNGGMTMQVESVELVGEGALQIAYEKLKKKLEEEGLFAVSRKKELPLYPHRIGVITSRSGAVINDFLSNIGKFGFEILFVDSKVEGQDSIKDLLLAIETLKNKDLDVLVIMRGGGSLESFQAFNNEILVRAVCNFPVPVLTGIGHDKDAPLVSMVSDRNVSTPTAVANLLNSSWTEALALVRLAEEKIFSNFTGVLRDNQFLMENAEMSISNRFSDLLAVFRQAEESLLRAVTYIEATLGHMKESISLYSKDLFRSFEQALMRMEDGLIQSSKLIEISNPENQLARGYSIVRTKGKVLRSVKDVTEGDRLDITVSDGIIQSITK